MGRRYAIYYTENSSGYKKPASLYDGESYTRTTNGSNNTGGVTQLTEAGTTYQAGAIEGVSTYDRSTSRSDSYNGSNGARYNSNNEGATQASGAIGGSASSSSSNEGRNPNNDTSTTYSTSYGGSNSSFTQSGEQVSAGARVGDYESRGANAGETSWNRTESTYSRSGSNKGTGVTQTATKRTVNFRSYSDTDGATVYINSQFGVTSLEVANSVVTAEAGGTVTNTAEADSDGNATFTVIATNSYSASGGNIGGYTIRVTDHIENAETTTDFIDDRVIDYTGFVTESSSSRSYTIQVNQGASTKQIQTLGRITLSKFQSTTETSSRILGTFFDEEITQRYTAIVSTDSIEQLRTATVTTEAATDSWDDSAYQWLINSTLSADGGVYGYLSNNKESIGTSVTTSSYLSEVQDSYFYEGQDWMPKNDQFYSTRGTEDPESFDSTNTYLGETGEAQRTAQSGVTEEYSFIARGGDTSSYYKSHGFLDSTIATNDSQTSSAEITWEETYATQVASRETLTTTNNIETGPTQSIEDNFGTSTSSYLKTIGSSSVVSTYSLSSRLVNIKSTSTRIVQSRNEDNISWSSIDNSPKPYAFDRFIFRYNSVYPISYSSMEFNDPFFGGEIAFCSVTDIDRQSRKKAEPPKLKYTEWYLSTTDVSDGVTIYAKTSSSGESFFVPQARSSLLNDMIYMPKDQDFQVVDHFTNSMSFSRNNTHTQIVEATFTWTTDADDLTRSTTSNFLRLFEVQDGLQTVEQPKSYRDFGGGFSRGGTFFGGDNAYADAGTLEIRGDAEVTVFDNDGGSTLYQNNSSENLVTTSTLPSNQMLSISGQNRLIQEQATYKNNYRLTSRSYLPPTYNPYNTSTPSYYSSYYYYGPYY